MGDTTIHVLLHMSPCNLCGTVSPFHNKVLGAAGVYCTGTCTTTAMLGADNARSQHRAAMWAGASSDGVLRFLETPLWMPTRDGRTRIPAVRRRPQ
jgi:hypothetical protein